MRDLGSNKEEKKQPKFMYPVVKQIRVQHILPRLSIYFIHHIFVFARLRDDLFPTLKLYKNLNSLQYETATFFLTIVTGNSKDM